jgi:BASS family bile acid:Na+ symporter
MFSEQSPEIQEMLVGGFVVFMMLSVGIDLTVDKVRAVFRSPRVLGMALVINYLVVPAIFVGLIALTGLDRMWATGLLFVAVAPGGPVAGVMVQNAKGHLALAVSLLVLMNLLNTVLTPLGIWLLGALPNSDGGMTAILGMVQTIIWYQILPLASAMALRHFWPTQAKHFQPTIEKAAKILLLVASAVILAGEISRLNTLPLALILVVHLAAGASILISWLVTPGSQEDKIAIALTTPYRSISVVLLLLSSWVHNVDAMLAAMAYSAAMLWMCIACSFWIRNKLRVEGFRILRDGS